MATADLRQHPLPRRGSRPTAPPNHPHPHCQSPKPHTLPLDTLAQARLLLELTGRQTTTLKAANVLSPWLTAVDRLLERTGRRANLIAIACNEILENLDNATRVLTTDHLERALASTALDDALAGWTALTHDAEENRLDGDVEAGGVRGEPYRYRVPLFVEQMREQPLDALFEKEVRASGW